MQRSYAAPGARASRRRRGFDSLEEAADAVQALLLRQRRAANYWMSGHRRLQRIGKEARRAAGLFLEFNGLPRAVAAHTELALELCADCGGRDAEAGRN